MLQVMHSLDADCKRRPDAMTADQSRVAAPASNGTDLDSHGVSITALQEEYARDKDLNCVAAHDSLASGPSVSSGCAL